MSGLYPRVHGHRTMTHALHPEREQGNLLRSLKQNGYFVWWGGKNDLVPGLKPDELRVDVDVATVRAALQFLESYEGNQFIELIDFPATVEELSGISLPHDHFGRSLLPLFAHPETVHRNAVFCEGGRREGVLQCIELREAEIRRYVTTAFTTRLLPAPSPPSGPVCWTGASAAPTSSPAGRTGAASSDPPPGKRA